MTRPKAVVLLSGGMDSSTTAAVAMSRGFEVHALTFRYGQRHHAEVEVARRVADRLRVAQHVVLNIDLRALGGSALTSDIPVPKDTPLDVIGQHIPVTYVPARNTIFLSFALGLAEVIEAGDIFLGANALDYSGYPDCRPEFIRAFEAMANLATRAATEQDQKITIHTPLIQLSKREIIDLGLSLGVDYGLTLTCYDPSPEGAACGRCEACLLRLKGFREAGIEDPATYYSVINNFARDGGGSPV
jgi:7-cyano-7-deazaguanine synthase